MSISYAFFKEKVKHMNESQINFLKLVVILFDSFSPPFPLFCSLSQHCGVLDSGALFVNLNGFVFGVLVLSLSSRTDVHKTMDRLNQGGRNSLLLRFSQILWKVTNASFCINFIVELFVLIKNVKKKLVQGMVIYKL